MIYVAQIEIPHRTVWGNAHSLELLLPSRIHNIRGYLVNAVLKTTTQLKRCYSSQFKTDTNGQIITESVAITENISYQRPQTSQILRRQPISSQIGVVSLSLNNTQIIADSTPLCVTQHLNKQGIVPNLITLSEPESVRSGSFLRIIIEEQQLSPFLTQDEWANLSADLKMAYMGNIETKPTNSYTAKIYLNYD